MRAEGRVIGVSDRGMDAFDNGPKAEYRARHLQVLREQVPELWDEESPQRLQGAWLELMGATGWRTLDLLVEAGALTPAGFVGVDLDGQRIEDYRRRYPGARWLAGDVLDLVQRVELEDVAVVHYDAYEAVASSRLDHIGEQLAVLLRRGVDRFGAALLLWNADLDSVRRLGQAAPAALRAHAATIAGVLRSALGKRREIGNEALLPPGAEVAVAAPAFVGAVGAFEVYRGKRSGHRMACCRAVLR